MTNSTVDIIGAGIGGLTTAIALERQGIECRIFEQAAELKPVGAGLLLGINAMQVLQRLGLGDQVESHGNHVTAMTITDQHLAPMSTVELTQFEDRYHARSVAIHRGVLQQILVDRLAATPVALGQRLVRIEPGPAINRLVFEDGTEVDSTATIGADGIHSNVRRGLFPQSSMRSAGQTCWRGVTTCPLPARYHHEMTEIWGPRGRFGFLRLADGQMSDSQNSESTVYWYALRSETAGESAGSALADLQQLFGSYDPLVGEILGSTDPDALIRNEIEDLRPLPRWYDGRTCLIGDAAHAATPNLGQGACQAIEDADVLAGCLVRYDRDRAFAEFEALRRRKAERVVKYSWQMGKLAHQANPLLRTMRNGLLKATPPSVNRQRMQKIFELTTV